jgi:hypothetical protein
VTRREFFAIPAAAGVASALPAAPLVVPIHLVSDSHAKCTPDQLRGFSTRIWPEAVRDFERCGIHLESSARTGEVRRLPSGKPLLTGLEYGVINFVLTDHIPIDWDSGRALTGVTTRYDGYHVCMVALNYAHCHQIPFLSVNTCVHELLHVLLGDIFERNPAGFLGEAREFRIDLYATRLWLFRDGAAIRQAAGAYVDRLSAGLTSPRASRSDVAS